MKGIYEIDQQNRLSGNCPDILVNLYNKVTNLRQFQLHEN